ncbi:MAG: DUF423 domain-containing protein [Gammaproteobacteria bacterium]
MWAKIFMAAGGCGGCAGVVLGALQTHTLATRVDGDGLATLSTASDYLLVHGLLLVAIAMGLRAAPAAFSLRLAGTLIMLGMICFCGGLTISALGGGAWAAIAPLGGIGLIAGWLTLAVYGSTGPRA